MKKTLVAIAAAAAVTGAMAESTLYGWVDQSHNTTTVTTNSVNSTTNAWGSNNAGSSAIGVKGEEDLGDGLKATYLMELEVDAQAATADKTKNRQSYVGLTGGFGDVKIGQQYTPLFNAYAAVDPSGISGHGGFIKLASNQQGNGFYYNTASMSGFSAVLGLHEGGTKDTTAGNVTTYGLSYTNGPVYLFVAQETTKAGTTTVGLNTQTVGVSTGDLTVTQGTASYDMGVAKLGLVTESMSSSGSSAGSAKETTLTISAPFGALMVGAEFSNASYTIAGRTDTNDLTSSGLVANYSLSKKTMVYFRYGTTDDKYSTSAITKQTVTALGLMVNF